MGGEGRGRDEREGEDRGVEKGVGRREGGRTGEDDCYSKLFRPCVGLTVRILHAVYESTRSGPFATRLYVRLFVYLSHSCAVLKRLKGSSCPFV